MNYSASNATVVKQNKSIYYSCPGATGSAGPVGAVGPVGATGGTGPTGQQGVDGSFTGDLIYAQGINIELTSSPVNDYILIGSHSFYTITSANSTPADITGIYGGTQGRVLILVNNTPAVQSFYQEDTRSAAPYRFVLGSSSVLINTNGTITFLYVTGLTVGAATGQGRWLMTASS